VLPICLYADRLRPGRSGDESRKGWVLRRLDQAVPPSQSLARTRDSNWASMTDAGMDRTFGFRDRIGSVGSTRLCCSESQRFFFLISIFAFCFARALDEPDFVIGRLPSAGSGRVYFAPGSSRRNISATPGHEIEPPGLAIRGGAHILDARRNQKVILAIRQRHCLNESAPARLCRASRGVILQRRWSRRA